MSHFNFSLKGVARYIKGGENIYLFIFYFLLTMSNGVLRVNITDLNIPFFLCYSLWFQVDVALLEKGMSHTSVHPSALFKFILCGQRPMFLATV